MKIKFINNTAGIGYAFMENTEINCTDAFAEEMIELGYAVKVHSLPAALPDDLPGRPVLIEAGFESLDEIKKLDKGALIEIKGIGEKLADKIIAYVA